MGKYQYQTKGTCASLIEFEIEDGILHNVQFKKGCKGNLQGVSRLVEGLPVETVIERLNGINCQGNTSCPDQLAQALKMTIGQQKQSAAQ